MFSAGADSIVGVGFLSSSSSVVSTGDELPTASPPEEELVDDLEEDDRVTGEFHELAVSHNSPYMIALLFFSSW